MSNVNKPLNIIVLKTNDVNHTSETFSSSNCENKQTSNDRYVEFLSKNLTQPPVESIEQINLLKFEFCNIEELKNKLIKSTCLISPKSNETSKYKCIILTSRQACEAIHNCLFEFIDNVPNTVTKIDEINSKLEDKFIIYCVGQATANRFKQIINKLRYLNPSIDRFIIIRSTENLASNESQHKQNAKMLANLIVNDYNIFKKNESSNSLIDFDKYALYPCSSIRKDDISNELSKHNIYFDEIISYKTVNCEIGLETLRNRLKTLNLKMNIICLIFFSPSACDSVFKDSYIKDLILDNLENYRLVSIGPSTTCKLKSCLPNDKNKNDSIEIYQLDEPSPQSLYNKLNLFIQ